MAALLLILRLISSKGWVAVVVARSVDLLIRLEVVMWDHRSLILVGVLVYLLIRLLLVCIEGAGQGLDLRASAGNRLVLFNI